MKTVLAPDAPWPVKPKENPTPIKRKPKPKISSSKVDQNFERWLSTIPPLKTKGNNNA
jgi:hypothetical protein